MSDGYYYLSSSEDELSFTPVGDSYVIEDLLEIANISEDSIIELSNKLLNASGFMNSDQLKEMIDGFVPNEDQSHAILRIVFMYEPSRLDDVSEYLEAWRTESDENAQQLPPESMDAIKKNLSLLIVEYPAWNRFKKAFYLKTITGNEIQSFDLICDLRPVFDENRETIEGLFPLTTLKLQYQKQNESIEEIELTISPQMIERMEEKIKMAKRKIETLGSSIKDWIPDGSIED